MEAPLSDLRYPVPSAVSATYSLNGTSFGSLQASARHGRSLHLIGCDHRSRFRALYASDCITASLEGSGSKPVFNIEAGDAVEVTGVGGHEGQ